MAFSAIIAHRITRDAPGSATTLTLRNDNLPMNGVLEELAYELKTQFIRKGGKHYGRFSNETGDHPFSSWLNEYRAEKMGLTNFTQKVLQHYKLLLDDTDVLLDSYVLFAFEKIEAGEFLHVFMLEHMSGLHLDSDITLTESQHLDISGFTLAAKINLTEWDAGDSTTYLALVRLRGDKELTEAFARLVGFSDKHDVKSDTLEFLHLVDNFSETLDEPIAKSTRTQVVNYCLEQNKAGKAVVIADLSQTLAQEIKSYEPERFKKFVEEKQPDIKAEFIPDSAQLRNYVRISGRNDSLSMSFASECLGKEIVYDAAEDVLTIKNIPPALKARLLKHLHGK